MPSPRPRAKPDRKVASRRAGDARAGHGAKQANGGPAAAGARPAGPASGPARADEAAVVQVRGLGKRYDTGSVQVEALRGVDLAVRKGEVLAVMGPSGCGKTTLLNCVSGLDEPSSGEVLVEGRDLAAMDDDTRTRFRAERLGFVFQSFNLLPVLTAAENVMLPLLVLGQREEPARRVALKAMEAVEVAHRADHLPRELSGGEQQRVAIARSLVNDPAIIFADEPTGNLDTGTGSRILQLLQDLNRARRVTLVVVTHDPKMTRFAHRVLHMDSGRIVRTERGGAAWP